MSSEPAPRRHGPARRRLLALDLDGTLLRPGDAIDARDARAVRRALDAGVVVTIATGRVAGGTLPTARALGITAPLVCGDGGVLVCGRTGARLEQQAISLAAADDVVGAFGRHGLAPFVLMYDAIHCDETGRPHAEYMRLWSPDVTVHPSLGATEAWRREGEIAFAVGIGPERGVQAAHEQIVGGRGDDVVPVTFRVRRKSGDWALLARPAGCSKGAALARLAERLGVAREDACAVGDWLNDVSMFQWAGRSFAMGQAPEAVRAAATDTLVATSETGGGVAEAVDRWLGAQSEP